MKADMDPVHVRFVQLLIAEILGVILCLGGLVLLFLGAAGKLGFLMQGQCCSALSKCSSISCFLRDSR